MKAICVFAIAVLGLLTGCGEAPRILTEVPSPAAAGSGEPNLSVGADGTMFLSWIEKHEDEHVLLFSVWEGDTWSPSTEVARGSDWFVNWADFPSVNALEDGTLFAHWLAMNGEGTYSYGVQVATSADGGRSWNDPVVPHDGSPTEHGFVTMIPQGDKMGMVWLDGRETGGHGHDDGHGEGGAMTLRYAAMDRDGNLSDEVLLDSRICDCCSTDAVLLPDGSITVVYRDRSEEEVRDISAVRREGGSWGEPLTVNPDLWKINGCPVNGPELAQSGTTIAAAWFTMGQDQKSRVKVAFSTDGGATFGEPVQADDGNPLGRVDLIFLDHKTVLVTWMEDVQDGSAEIRKRRVTVDGEIEETSSLVAVTRASRGSGFPRMLIHEDTVFFAWTDYGEPSQVKTSVYR